MSLEAIGLLLTAIGVASAVIGGVFRFARSLDSGGGDLVARLDKRVAELEEDLEEERKGRAEDNRQWQRKFDDLQEQLSDLGRKYERVTTELEITRMQKGIPQ